MTLTIHIFSFTITVSKREVSLEQALHNENAKKIYEENRAKIVDYIRNY